MHSIVEHWSENTGSPFQLLNPSIEMTYQELVNTGPLALHISNKSCRHWMLRLSKTHRQAPQVKTRESSTTSMKKRDKNMVKNCPGSTTIGSRLLKRIDISTVHKCLVTDQLKVTVLVLCPSNLTLYIILYVYMLPSEHCKLLPLFFFSLSF